MKKLRPCYFLRQRFFLDLLTKKSPRWSWPLFSPKSSSKTFLQDGLGQKEIHQSSPKSSSKSSSRNFFIDFYIGFFLNLNKSSLKKSPLKNFLMNFLGWPGPRKKFRHPTGGKKRYRETWASTRPAPKQSCQKWKPGNWTPKSAAVKKYYLETWPPPRPAPKQSCQK